MGWVVNNQGTATSSSTAAASFTLSIGAGNAVSAGSLVVVGVTDLSTAQTSSAVTDSRGNTYTTIVSTSLNKVAASGFAALFYSVLATGLTTGTPDTITYTKGLANKIAVLSALSATGNSTAPLDSAVTNSNSSTLSGNAPTVTSGSAGVTGELRVAWVGIGSTSALTEDATHGWATPLSSVVGVTSEGIGGNQVTAGTSAIIYSPGAGANGAWADIVTGFQPSIATGGVPLRMQMGMGR